MKAHVLVLAILVLGCDKTSETSTTPSASAAPSAPPVVSAPPSASAAPSATASAAPADTKDVTVSIKDVSTEPSKTVKASLGGSVTLFLPDSAGSSWAVDTADKTLGKAKEEIMPGFGPGTNAHSFQWSTKNPLLKAGETHKVTFVNKKAGKNFTLTIEL
jgi:hypothetical protein